MSKVMKVIVSSDFIREKLVKLMYEGDILHKDAEIIQVRGQRIFLIMNIIQRGASL